jgi:hypothetical protein
MSALNTMKFRYTLTAFAAALISAQICAGHGLPIGVGVHNAKLTLAYGAPDQSGSARLIFLNDGEGGQLEHVFVPGFGNVGLTSLPGFEITGMDPNSELFLKVIPRPGNGIHAAQQRLLWHWNANTQKVEVDPSNESLVVASDFGQISVPQTATPLPPLLRVANPEVSDLGEHVHFLRYLLGDSPPASLGAFGFFAQLTSPAYAPSEPLLVIFNNGIEEAEVLAKAALGINTLPGDYNRDGDVGAADYVVWRDSNGAAPDYQVWRSNYGATILRESGAAAEANRLPDGAAGIPEPTSAVLATVCLLRWIAGRRRHF